MLRRWDYKEILLLFGIIICLHCLVQSKEQTTEETRKQKIKMAIEKLKEKKKRKETTMEQSDEKSDEKSDKKPMNPEQLRANEEAIKGLLFKTKVTEEESKSAHIPEKYLCDACSGVAYAIEQIFMEAERRHKKSKLTETYLTDMIDDLCHNDYFWEAYGLREITGVKTFSGPGLASEKEFGFNMESDLWPSRMKDLCWKLIGEFETLELYEIFKKGKLMKLKETLCYQKFNYCQKSTRKSDEL